MDVACIRFTRMSSLLWMKCRLCKLITSICTHACDQQLFNGARKFRVTFPSARVHPKWSSDCRIARDFFTCKAFMPLDTTTNSSLDISPGIMLFYPISNACYFHSTGGLLASLRLTRKLFKQRSSFILTVQIAQSMIVFGEII